MEEGKHVTRFQIAAISLAGAFAFLSLAAVSRHWIGTRSGLAWFVLWSSAALAVAFPDLTVMVARVLGIARGADLVFYCSILGMFVGFFAVYIKLRRIERTITLIVRHVALVEARPGDSVEPIIPADGERGK
jgi:hypothetical protein